MKKLYYLSSGGPHGLDHMIPVFAVRPAVAERYHPMARHLIDYQNTLQVLIDYLGTLMWINIRKSELVLDK